MPAGPLVSIIIPTYNRRALALEAVASVLSQTEQDLEVVVADDGSTDGTGAALERLGDARVRYLPGSHGGEPATPRNRGLAAARGRWVAFLDSDDLWDAGKLAAQLAAVRDGDWSYTGYRVAGSGPVREFPALPTPNPVIGMLTDAVSVAMSTVLVATDLARAIPPFDRRAAFREDFLWIARLASRTVPCPVGPPLVTVRHHPGRSTLARRDHQLAWAHVLGALCREHTGPARAAVRRRLRGALWRSLPAGPADGRWWSGLRGLLG